MQPAEVGGLQGSAKENECQTRREVSPGAGQLYAGADNDERVQKVKRRIHVAGDINNCGSEDQIGKHIEPSLNLRVAPYRDQHDLQQRDGVPKQDDGDKSPHRHVGGGEPRNSQLDPQQEGDDDDAHLGQPAQPGALLKFSFHGQEISGKTGRKRCSIPPTCARSVDLPSPPIWRSWRIAACKAKSRFHPPPRRET